MQEDHVRQVIVRQTSAPLALEKSSEVIVGTKARRNGKIDGFMK